MALARRAVARAVEAAGPPGAELLDVCSLRTVQKRRAVMDVATPGFGDGVFAGGLQGSVRHPAALARQVDARRRCLCQGEW
jgi:hypothetical protein